MARKITFMEAYSCVHSCDRDTVFPFLVAKRGLFARWRLNRAVRKYEQLGWERIGKPYILDIDNKWHQNMQCPKEAWKDTVGGVDNG